MDMTTFNLRHLKLRSGEQFRDTIDVQLEPLVLGGSDYLPVPAEVPAELTVTKATTGSVYQLSFRARLHGPCFRCLRDSVLDQAVDAREYQATNPEGRDELRTPYLSENLLDVHGWARDAIALAVPEQILCRDDCAGLCPMCGKDLNVDPHEHEEEHGDPRWSVLAELRERLE